MFNFGQDGVLKWSFDGGALLKGETDGSSYMNGGLRVRHTGLELQSPGRARADPRPAEPRQVPGGAQAGLLLTRVPLALDRRRTRRAATPRSTPRRPSSSATTRCTSRRCSSPSTARRSTRRRRCSARWKQSPRRVSSCSACSATTVSAWCLISDSSRSATTRALLAGSLAYTRTSRLTH